MEGWTPTERVTLHSHGLHEVAARLALYLFTLEMGILITLFGIYKVRALQWMMLTIMWTHAGFVIVIGLCVLLVSGFFLVQESVLFCGNRHRMWLLAISANLITQVAASSRL